MKDEALMESARAMLARRPVCACHPFYITVHFRPVRNEAGWPGERLGNKYEFVDFATMRASNPRWQQPWDEKAMIIFKRRDEDDLYVREAGEFERFFEPICDSCGKPFLGGAYRNEWPLLEYGETRDRVPMNKYVLMSIATQQADQANQ